jgi:hypothetical protein
MSMRAVKQHYGRAPQQNERHAENIRAHANAPAKNERHVKKIRAHANAPAKKKSAERHAEKTLRARKKN